MFCIISDTNKGQMSVLVLRHISTCLRNVQVRNSLQLLHEAKRKNLLIFRILQKPILKPLMSNISTSTRAHGNVVNADSPAVDEDEGVENEDVDSEERFIQKYLDPKDRSRIIPPETSIKYLGMQLFSLTLFLLCFCRIWHMV